MNMFYKSITIASLLIAPAVIKANQKPIHMQLKVGEQRELSFYQGYDESEYKHPGLCGGPGGWGALVKDIDIIHVDDMYQHPFKVFTIEGKKLGTAGVVFHHWKGGAPQYNPEVEYIIEVIA